MSREYRDETREIIRDGNWTFWQIFPLAVLAIVATSAVGFMLNSAGLFGRTVVEREVFEASYQRQSGLKAQIATDEANLAEIERKLANPNLDADTRYNLEAQASAARSRIDATRRMQ